MLVLKSYQQNTLDIIKAYLKNTLKFRRPDIAYMVTTADWYGEGITYRTIPGLESVPYICIRIPTGGGKTLVACYSAGLANSNLLWSDRTLILWLVPSNPIKEQTLKALRNKEHPYREALESSLGTIAVLDNYEALSLRKTAFEQDTIIIVSTMQAFRIEDTEGRKVYEASGELKDHFIGLPSDVISHLDCKGEEPIPSLANVIKLHRPIMIVDEAHNARTALSFDTLARFNPSCILEFTATPDMENIPSNVLYSVSAAELKAENMIKVPLMVECKSDWMSVLADAINMRAHLEKLAIKEESLTGEYIRPIILIQAQPQYQNRETVTWEVIEKHLIENHLVPIEHIAVETGLRRDLDNIPDILAKESKVRFIITIQAIREGWDCPFASVLCSVSDLGSTTAVEQLVGRILRLPNAIKKRHQELNESYAFVSSPSFGNALDSLEYALIKNGFEKKEARDFILPKMSTNIHSGSLFIPSVTVELPEIPKITALPKDLADKVVFTKNKITFTGVMDDKDRATLKKCFTTNEGKELIEQIYLLTRDQLSNDKPTSGDRGKAFTIPYLGIYQDEMFEVFEETHFMERPWKLTGSDNTLSEEEYSFHYENGYYGSVDVNEKGHLSKQNESSFLYELQNQMVLFSDDLKWTQNDLVLWLDRGIPHPDIRPEEAVLYINQVIIYLVNVRGISLEKLVRTKFMLRDSIKNKIKKIRDIARKQLFQAVILEDQRFDVKFDDLSTCLTFDPLLYPYNYRYDGDFNFQKHYYRAVGDLHKKGEEFDCARYIDSLDEIEYWIRNIDRKPTSFSFRISKDNFYPDFLCRLKDGRYLIVEYKGKHLWNDADEERLIGQLWEDKSKGQCLFIMITERNFGAINAKINQQ